MAKATKTARLSVRISPSLKRRLAQAAKDEGRTLGDFVTRLLAAAVTRRPNRQRRI